MKKQIMFRIEEELKDEFKAFVKENGTTMTDELKKMLKKLVKSKYQSEEEPFDAINQ